LEEEFFLYAIFIFSAQAVLAQSLTPRCSNDTSSSTYEANLNHLLSSFSSDTKIDYGFYNSSYGQNSDQVYAIGLCRGDVNPDFCRGCLKNATSALKQLCPNQKEAIGWYDECMLRYSNRSIYGVRDIIPEFVLWNPEDVPANNVDQFTDDLRTVMENLSSHAAAGGPLKFATGNITVPNFKTLYGLVQCTPDLSEKDCSDCFRGEIEYIPICCDRKRGGQINRPSCRLRFEVYQFYNYSAADTSFPISPVAPPVSPVAPPVSPPPPFTNINSTCE
jgi:hypothetical protein